MFHKYNLVFSSNFSKKAGTGDLTTDFWTSTDPCAKINLTNIFSADLNIVLGFFLDISLSLQDEDFSPQKLS